MKFYEGPGAESTAPAYEMLLRAQMSKDNAIGNFLTPLTQALDRNRQLAMQQQELDQRMKAQASEDAWKRQYGSLQERELGLKTRQMDRADASDAASAAAFTQMMGGGAPEPMGGTVTPRQSPVFKGAAESLLAPRPMQGGNSQAFNGVDPKLIATMTPADRIQFMAMHDRLQEHAAMNEKRAFDLQAAQAKQAEVARNIENTRGQIAKALKGGSISNEEAGSYKDRLDKGDADKIGKEIQDKIEEHGRETAFSTFVDVSVKNAKKLAVSPSGVPDPVAQGLLDKIKSDYANSNLPYKDREESVRSEIDHILRVGEKPEQDRGIFIPDVGMEVRLNTPLSKGGTYKLSANGDPELPRAMQGELNGLVDMSVANRKKNDATTGLILAAGPGTTPDQKARYDATVAAEAAFPRKTAINILHSLGWTSSAEDFTDTIGTRHANEGQMPFSTDAQAKAPTQELFKGLESLPNEAARRAAIEEHLFGPEAVKQRKAKNDADAIKEWERQQRMHPN